MHHFLLSHNDGVIKKGEVGSEAPISSNKYFNKLLQAKLYCLVFWHIFSLCLFPHSPFFPNYLKKAMKNVTEEFIERKRLRKRWKIIMFSEKREKVFWNEMRAAGRRDTQRR